MRSPQHRARRAWLMIIGAVALALPSTALADPWTEPGGYWMLGGVNGFEHFQNVEEDFSDSWGVALGAGYRLNRWLAFEGTFDILTGFDVLAELEPPVPPGLPNPAPLSLDGGSFTANVKGYLPWFGRLEPFGVVGIGGAWRRLRTAYKTGEDCGPAPAPIFYSCTDKYTELGSSGGFIARFGGGVDFWLTEHIALTIGATYNVLTGDQEDLPYTNLAWGVIWKPGSDEKTDSSVELGTPYHSSNP
jgi:opacity protein-like surface antigen